MDNLTTKEKTCFWAEISEYNILIPSYQRDYAQGRIDNGRIDNIREVFVSELYEALTKQKQCHLGLVFGSFDESDKSFIAVDGQQRLTTVFLLHWYIAWRENNLSKYKDMLKKFQWNTRSFSAQFVNLLFSLPNKKNHVENHIKENCDYFPIWEKDPTVKSMLTMLQEIEKQYPGTELSNNLFSNKCKIQYDILKLSENSDARTYLKMNSRGRNLTTFENFKSRFIAHINNKAIEHKFDNEWLNFMLSIEKNNEAEKLEADTTDSNFSDPDVGFMYFINEYTYILLELNKTKKQNNQCFVDAKIHGNYTDVPFIGFEKYIPAFNKLDYFEKSFDWILTNYDVIKSVYKEFTFDKKEAFFFDIIIKGEPTYSHRAHFFALLKYAELEDYSSLNETNIEKYKKWFRVFRNLITNTDIVANNISNICKAINKVNNSSIYEYLQSNALEAFHQNQIKEEIIKAKRIIQIPDFERKILDAENFAFFKGSICFLFRDSKGNLTDWDNFTKYYNNAKKYFNSQGVTPDYRSNAILLRTFIAKLDNWNQFWKYAFDNTSETWRYLLLSGLHIKPINFILKESINLKETFVNYNSILKEQRTKEVQNDLVKTSLLSIIAAKKPLLHWYGNQYCLYPYNKRKEETKWVIANKRNHILSELLKKGKIKTKHQLPNCNMFWGWSVEFEYKKNYFCWNADAKIYKWDRQKEQYTPEKGYNISKISNTMELLSFIDNL